MCFGSGAGPSSGIAEWTRFAFTHTQFQIAALTRTISLYSLPAGYHVEGIKVFQTIQFAAPGLGQYQVSCGDPAAVDSLSPAWDVAVAYSASNIQLIPLLAGYDQAAATALTITVTADVNLNLSTAGALYVWLKLARAL